MQRSCDELKRIVGVERWSEREARVVVRAWGRSGRALGSFAREHGISAQRLSWWARRLKGAEDSRRAKEPKGRPRARAGLELVPAVVVGGDGVRDAMVVVRMPDGIEIELRDAERASATEVARLVAELRRSCS
jgi:hypothetical protein